MSIHWQSMFCVVRIIATRTEPLRQTQTHIIHLLCVHLPNIIRINHLTFKHRKQPNKYEILKISIGCSTEKLNKPQTRADQPVCERCRHSADVFPRSHDVSSRQKLALCPSATFSRGGHVQQVIVTKGLHAVVVSAGTQRKIQSPNF